MTLRNEIAQIILETMGDIYDFHESPTFEQQHQASERAAERIEALFP